jgi:hypothetical protein
MQAGAFLDFDSSEPFSKFPHKLKNIIAPFSAKVVTFASLAKSFPKRTVKHSASLDDIESAINKRAVKWYRKPQRDDPSA